MPRFMRYFAKRQRTDGETGDPPRGPPPHWWPPKLTPPGPPPWVTMARRPALAAVHDQFVRFAGTDDPSADHSAGSDHPSRT
jgi:hypothetical protein